MLCIIQRRRRFFAYTTALSLWLITHPVFANLPKPPDGWYAENGNWFEAAGKIGKSAATYGQMLFGVVLVATVFMGVLRGYRIAHERQEMSHFFRAIGVGLVCLTVGGTLIYAIGLAIPKNM